MPILIVIYSPMRRVMSDSAPNYYDPVLVLIVSLAAFLPWLLSTAAEKAGLHHQLYPSYRKRRIYCKLFLARLLLVLDRCRSELERLTKSIADMSRWIKSDHDVLLSK